MGWREQVGQWQTKRRWREAGLVGMPAGDGRMAYRPVATHPAPDWLVIGLHGLGSGPLQMETLVGLHSYLPVNYVAPEGFYAHPTGGRAWFPLVGDGDGGFDAEDRKLAAVLQRLRTFVTTAQQQFDMPPERTVLLGYSQGAALSLAYSLLHGDTIGRGVVLTGGLLPAVRRLVAHQAASTEQLVSPCLFIGYGTKDPLLTPADARAMANYCRRLGHAVALRDYPIPHVVSAVELEDVANWLNED